MKTTALYSALKILELDILPTEKLWLLLLSNKIPKSIRIEASCQFAESVLLIFEKEYPNDKRPRDAIAARRDYVLGKITLEELVKARKDAKAAAIDAKNAAVSTQIASAAAVDALAEADIAEIVAYCTTKAAKPVNTYAAFYAAIATYAGTIYAAAEATANLRPEERNNQVQILKKLIKEYQNETQ